MIGGDESGELGEEERANGGPLLPPEDRLWRHPSEVTAERALMRLDATDVRNRWLAREPTRATAWTAGLVGALLATGIVLVGTHLATVLTKPPVIKQTAASSVVPTVLPGTTNPGANAHGFGLGAGLDAAVLRLGSATVSIHAFRGSDEVASLGVVLGPGGIVVAATTALTGASSILVDPPYGGSELVAAIVASDPRSGLALLHVNGMPDLPQAELDGAKQMTTAAFALAVTSAGGATYAPASLTRIDIAPKIGGSELIDACATDLASEYAPLGSPVIDSAGRLIGMIVGTVDGKAVLSPAWLMDPVADELNELGRVNQGWMGINGETIDATTPLTKGNGVRVLAVAPRSAAAKAGIVAGDVITSIGSDSVRSIAALQGHLYVARPGEVVVVGLKHHQQAMSVRVTLAGAHG